MPPAPISPLIDLGFTALEAEIYTWLLGESPATGYRVAQALGKPAANIYKALESLEAKGVVLVEEGSWRLFRPLAVEELLGRLERRFRERKDEAARALADLSAPVDDDRVYRLRSADAVLERARAMLARAEQVALIDLFPGVVETLRPAMEEAAARGVEVGVLAYAPVEVAGATVVVSADGEETLARWPGQWLCVIIDGAEHLIAFLSPDGSAVRQAVWTRSLYLSWVYHSAHSAGFALAAVRRAALSGADGPEMRRILDEYSRFLMTGAPGYRHLRRRVDESTLSGGSPS